MFHAFRSFPCVNICYISRIAQVLTFVNRKCGITHARFLPLRSAVFGDEEGGAAVHDAGGLLRGLAALKEGVRLVEDDVLYVA